VIVVCGEALIDMVVSGDGTRVQLLAAARSTPRGRWPASVFLRHFSDIFLKTSCRMLADRLAADGASLALASFGPEPTSIAVAKIGKDGLAEYEFVTQGTPLRI